MGGKGKDLRGWRVSGGGGEDLRGQRGAKEKILQRGEGKMWRGGKGGRDLRRTKQAKDL